ncbi:MAG: tRNA pseudouridine(38-40) synthase TruA [Paludibacteraceae bacterium]|nr:tRNA pseudouridine(38-40) synthase TruA [Paludibacteraceae bacterium]
MRYFVRFTYNGTTYHGSQTQPNAITVQETLEQCFSTILRRPIALTFAGRTDAGVHALEMFAHFDTDLPINSKLLNSKLNSLLPPSIVVHSIVPVLPDAHARFSATSRTYMYRVTESKDPFNLNLATQVAPGLDYELMNDAAQYLIGTHNFASFCKVHTDVRSTICTVTEAYWSVHSQFSIFNPPFSMFTITADRFLRNMVRAIVGTLFMVGRHKITIAQFRDIIEAKNRCAAGQSAPADGLYLVHVEYPKIIYQNA